MDVIINALTPEQIMAINAAFGSVAEWVAQGCTIIEDIYL
jgi:hypothetical protein